MGGKQSRSADLSRKDSFVEPNGQPQARAIARGRVYVLVHYPRDVEKVERAHFSNESFRDLLGELQKIVPDFEVTLEAGMTERFCQHANFYNSSDPEKLNFKQRVLVEVFYTGMYGVNLPKEQIRGAVIQHLDPENICHVDLRSEMGRYHTTPHLETLLRI